MINCKNCGAPRDSKCHYCGTVYVQAASPVSITKKKHISLSEILVIAGIVVCPGLYFFDKIMAKKIK